ncbi:MAG: thiamine-phosphate kinase [Ahrensia sp.]|nr:thiamine-phosphate kinase [Ahrensia sp.]
MRFDRLGEFELIEQHFAPLAAEGSFELKDDAALLRVPDSKELVTTHDTILEGVHFLPRDPVATIAQKALRVNLSDLIAKGATPLGYTLSLGVPDRWGNPEFGQFAIGLARDGARYGVSLLGGDTYRSPERLCVGVSLLGSVEEGRYVSRLTARAGDVIAVTGTIGNGALGLDVAQGLISRTEADAEWLRQCYQLPDPELQHIDIVSRFATASMDVSDGLLGDLAKLCRASGVSASVERNNVPLSDPVASAVGERPDLWERVLGGGDDYEVLFTMAKADVEACQEAASSSGSQVSVIGKIHAGNAGDIALTVEGYAVVQPAQAYRHF